MKTDLQFGLTGTTRGPYETTTLIDVATFVIKPKLFQLEF